MPADRLLLPVGQPGYVRAIRRRAAARSATVGSGGFSIETCLLYLAALGVFFATPPDTSRLLIIANSAHHGVIILMCKVIPAAGPLTETSAAISKRPARSVPRTVSVCCPGALAWYPR